MRHLIVALAGGSMLCSSVTAGTRESLQLKPASAWVLDYADESCRLARTFGEGKQQVTLVMTQFVPGDSFQTTLVGTNSIPPAAGDPLKVSFRFGPNEQQDDTWADTGQAGTKRVLILNGVQRIAPYTESEQAEFKAGPKSTSIPPVPIGRAREAAIRWLSFSVPGRKDLTLEIGAMDETMAKLRECSWDTIKQWGLDVEQQKTLSRHVVLTNKSSWLDGDDYPEEMVRGGYQGIVHFRLLVDAQGRPTTCKIQLSTRPKEFDDVVCRVVMKRAKFDPALDAAGKPVPSYWRQSVYFRLQQ